MRHLWSPWVWIGFALPVAGIGRAAVFPCSETGFDAALEAAAAGDPGPHTFACGPSQPLVLREPKEVASDLILDGEGALELRGLDARLRPAPPDAVLEIGHMTLVDPQISFAESTLALDLHDVAVSGRGGFSAVHLSIRQSVLREFHAARPSLLSSARLFGARDPKPPPTLEIVDTEISGCAAETSIIEAVDEPGSTLAITDSAITDNVAGRATIRALGAGGVIEGSTIARNRAQRIGAVWGDLTIENSTISGNRADGPGPLSSGALAGCPFLRNSTVSGNTHPDGHSYSDFTARGRSKSCSDLPVGRATFENTIMDGGCVRLGANAPHSLGGNIEVGGDSCGFVDATDQPSVSGQALHLAPLADNGGPTPTHALLPGSVARDAGVFAACTPVDQRGVPRPQGAECDSGAFELAPEPEVAIGRRRVLRRVLPWGRGIVPVAILGSEVFDVRDVDTTTLVFGPDRARPAWRRATWLADTDRDGFPDLLSWFRARDAGIARDDTEACISGALRDGTFFEGCDAVAPLPRHRPPSYSAADRRRRGR